MSTTSSHILLANPTISVRREDELGQGKPVFLTAQCSHVTMNTAIASPSSAIQSSEKPEVYQAPGVAAAAIKAATVITDSQSPAEHAVVEAAIVALEKGVNTRYELEQLETRMTAIRAQIDEAEKRDKVASDQAIKDDLFAKINTLPTLFGVASLDDVRSVLCNTLNWVVVEQAEIGTEKPRKTLKMAKGYGKGYGRPRLLKAAKTAKNAGQAAIQTIGKVGQTNRRLTDVEYAQIHAAMKHRDKNVSDIARGFKVSRQTCYAAAKGADLAKLRRGNKMVSRVA